LQQSLLKSFFNIYSKDVKEEKMKIAKLVTIGALSLLGCKNDANVWRYSNQGNFQGYPVKIVIEEADARMSNHGKVIGRYVTIAENPWGTRGYAPAYLLAKDIDPNKLGFEDIQIIPEQDITTGTDSSKVSLLEKFDDPIELERIFAYIDADVQKRIFIDKFRVKKELEK